MAVIVKLLKKFIKISTFVGLFCVYLLLSVWDLDKDVINPDGINWHTRTQAFNKALAEGDYSKTYQVYHPGITLMWLSGPVAKMSSDTTKETFLSRDYNAKLSLVIFGTLIFASCLVVLWKMTNFTFMLGFGLLLALEPFVIGMRRLYHLDYLMTLPLFLSFLLLAYFNYKSSKWYLITLAGLCFALSLLTKSVAIIFLPVVPFMFLLGNPKLLTKFLGFVGFILFSALFIFALFPPVWQNPIKSAPKYFQRIAFGVTDIGMEGKKEMGTSGRSENITLDDTEDDRDPNFYIASLFTRLSPAGAVLLVVSMGFYIYIILKGFVIFLWRLGKSIFAKKVQKTFNYSPASWLCFWSLGFSVASLVALTLSTKKSDRYEILVFPFLFMLVGYLFSRVKYYFVIPLAVAYIALMYYPLKPWHPYYLAYSNPYLGGLETRLRTLDGAPFGIGVYEAFNIVKRDLAENGNFGYYTVAGSKSIKAISVGSRFSRVPSCVTDYIVLFSFDDKPTLVCKNKYALVDTVKIGGFDYWYIYKRLNQKHESNYEPSENKVY